MSHRPLVFLSGLTVGDFLLWNWSLSGNHDVLALVSGLTLPPLTVACVWLLALSAARLLSIYTNSSRDRQARAGGRRTGERLAAPAGAAPVEGAAGPSGRSASRSPDKLAA